ncbi:MAG: NAD(P)-dependent oxidoreductase [Deltaproteobacteria bacterium]|nr:NAD(P)-dependent oxidoreductase [Deltaproteobacteria bacterium]
MTVLVTGGSGFIGRHLIERLKKDFHITNIDLVPSGLSGISELQHDVREPFYFNQHYTTTYHLAGLPWSKVVNPSQWLRESGEAFFTNTVGTYNVLKWIESDLFVFTSTANLYGKGRLFKETDPLNISSPYGYSKAVAERVVEASGRRYVIFRPGTVVGPRGRCFPNYLVWCAVHGKKVKIFNRGDTLRDIVDVRDVVSGLLSAEDLPNGIYNLGSGVETSGRELVELVAEIARERGHDLDCEYVDFYPPGYVPYSTLDISKILDTRMWRPKFKLDDTIRALFAYYENRDAVRPPRWDEI